MPPDKTASPVRPQTSDSLQVWLDYVSSVHWQNWDLGLARMHQLIDLMHLQQPAPQVYTVAGTNGKGSTCHALEAGLLALGYQVSCTLSPHIVRFNERFRINGAELDDASIVNALAAVDSARGDISLSYFEFASLAFLYVTQQAKVDAVVLEIGLGGRLDAFNAIDADVAVITSIGFDHEQYLGDTLDLIGAEKAGILRADQHVVLGPQMPDSVHARCAELGIEPLVYARDFEVTAQSDGQLDFRGHPLLSDVVVQTGNIAPQNIAVAAHALLPAYQQSGRAMTAQALLSSICQAQLAGRFELQSLHQRSWLLDVSHNVEGAQFLLQRMAVAGITVKAVLCGMLQDKHHQQFIAAIQQQFVVPWVMLDTQGERSLPGEVLAQIADRLGVAAQTAPDIEAGVTKLLSLTETHDVILCLGSFNLIEQFHNYASS